MRQHYQIRSTRDIDPTILWGGLVFLVFSLLTIIWGWRELRAMHTLDAQDVVNQPLEAEGEGSIDDRCPRGQTLVTDRRGIKGSGDGSYKLGAVTQCQ